MHTPISRLRRVALRNATRVFGRLTYARNMSTVTDSHNPEAALSDEQARQLRRDFPILASTVHDKPLTYLDFGATAQRPQAVLDAEREFLTEHNAAVHRGAHELAALATDGFETARETVAAFIGADADEIAWQQNATDALNTVTLALLRASLAGTGRFALQHGDEILITEAEHHANLVPWQQLAEATGAKLRWVPVNERGTWSVADARAQLSARTRVFAFAHVSNVTGHIAPVAELVELAHTKGAIVVLDACQSVPHRPVDVHELGVDFAAFSGHKMCGPTGIGVLYGRRDAFAELPPARTGGSMIEIVEMEQSTFLPAPTRFEAGTQPVSQAVALAAACDYLDAVGMSAIAAHEEALGARLVSELSALPGVRVLGDDASVPRSGLAAFSVAELHPHDLSQFLDAEGIAVRGGHHCAQPLHRRLGLTASTRASTYLTTSGDEIDHLVDAVGRAIDWFGAR